MTDGNARSLPSHSYDTMLHLVAAAWMFVVVLMAAAEATSPQGSWLAAVLMLVFYGLLPLALLLYLLGTPMRRRARRKED